MAARVTSERLVGRDAELAELRDALAAAAAGRPSLVLLAGSPAWARRGCCASFARPRARTALVLCGDSVELGDGELPYAPLVSALRPLVRDGDDVFDELAPGAREAWPGCSPACPAARGARRPRRTPRPRRTSSRRCSTSSTRLGASRPVLLVLEDVHWADRSTRAFLAFLGRSLGPSACWPWPATAPTSCTAATRCARCWPS